MHITDLKKYNFSPGQAANAANSEFTAKTDSAKVSSVPHGCVFVLGYFDGVHLGHQALLREAVSIAAVSGKFNENEVCAGNSCDNVVCAGKSCDNEVCAGNSCDNEVCAGNSDSIKICAWTFEDMPATKVAADSDADSAGLITTNGEKCALLREYGADYAVFEDFTALCTLSGREFFFDYLMRRYAPSCVVAGYNFRFGRGASCSADDLIAYAKEAGVACRVLPAFSLYGTPVSSTEIRRAIKHGDTARAAKLLGRPYSLTAEIVHGQMIGRTLGARTINQTIPEGKILPKLGVYCTAVTVSGESRQFYGVSNIGFRPTVDGRNITVETHIFGCEGDLYGRYATVAFLEMIREERKFDNLESLSAQIRRDEDAACEIIKKYGKHMK